MRACLRGGRNPLCYNSSVGTLFLVATPIGNLEDITLRALRVLGQVGLVAAEDTRRTRILFDRHAIHTPLLSYHEHNKHERLPRLLRALQAGDLALVSDAGTPGLSDPGYELVHAALAEGHTVTPVPGPSAPLAALVASGLPSDSFVFAGYLPRRARDRQRALDELAQESRTLILFETPHRLLGSLQAMAEHLGPEREAAVCRELTKLHEQILRGSLAEMLNHFRGEPPRGEITLVVAGRPVPERWEPAEVRRALYERLAAGEPAARAAREVAARAGWARGEVYRLATEER
jgi:16S rRNA (cytidine1402-2'-O)-methyltransferase